MIRAHVFVIALALAACVPQQPADPAVTARIVRACTASGLFKAVDGAVTMAVPAAALPVMVVNAGVDVVCADPARFAADQATVEWVVRNLGEEAMNEIERMAMAALRQDAACGGAPEDPNESMLERAVRVAAASGVVITRTQAHDIWQAMMDEWLWRNDR